MLDLIKQGFRFLGGLGRDDTLDLADSPRLKRSSLATEIGATGTAFYGGQITTDEFNVALKGTNGAKTYDKMRRTDAQVNATLKVIELPIRAATWTIEAEDDKVREFLEEQFFKRLSFDRILEHILLMLPFGFEVMEKVYELDGGKMWLRKLAHRAQTTIWRWDVDENDELAGVVQQARKGGSLETLKIPVEKLVVFSHAQEGNNFEGISILRSAYKHWFIKDNLYRIDAIAHERFGIGIPKATAPESYTPDDKTAMENALKNYKAGEKAYFFIPPGWEVDIMGANSNARYDPLPTIGHHDEMISRNVLAQFLNLGTTQTGSRSLGESMQDLFMFSIKAIGDQIQEGLNLQVVAPLLELNFPNAEGRIRYADLDTRPMKEVAETLKALVDSGIVKPDADLEDWARDVTDLPPRVEGETEEPEAAPEIQASEPFISGTMRAFSDGENRWRELREEERVCALNEVEQRQDAGTDQIVGVFASVKARWNKSLIEQVTHALSDGDPSDVGEVKIPAALKAEIRLGLVDEYEHLYRFGRQAVNNEANRAAKAQGSEFRDDILDDAEVSGLFIARADRFIDHISSRSESVAADRALSVFRTEGANISQASMGALEAELSELADSTVKRQARKTVSEAFSLGRQDQAKSMSESIEHAIYSAILDDNLCDECRPFDGEEFQLGSAEYMAAAPPNKDCEGGGNCRCMYVYVFKSEVTVT